MIFDLLLVALFAAFLFLFLGFGAWLADRPARTEYPHRWTD